MGSRGRKPRNISPPQASEDAALQVRRGRVERSAPVHGGHAHWVPGDLEAPPLRAKEDQSLCQESLSQYIGCCNKWALEISVASHKAYFSHSFRDPGSFHLCFCVQGCPVSLSDHPGPTNEQEGGTGGEGTLILTMGLASAARSVRGEPHV